MTTSPAEPPESTLATVCWCHIIARCAACEERAAAILAATPTAARIAQLEADLAAAEAKLAAVEALADEIDGHDYTPECADDRCRECLTAWAIRVAATQPAP